jgi:pimeloyl-ACP methyl ester carboxylesterase
VSFLFVHSPAVGPGTWRPVAELAAQVAPAALPDLTAAAEAEPPLWEAFVAAALAGAEPLSGGVHVVGHSGAGALLPEIGRRLGDRLRSLVFVDAVIPPGRGVHTTSTAMLEFLDGLGDDLLPRWSEWFGRRAMRDQVPRRTQRRRLVVEMPILPRSYYDEAIPVPDGWASGRCGYLRLSGAYDAEYAAADARNWPRRTIGGTHLSAVTEPEVVLGEILSLVAALDRP